MNQGLFQAFINKHISLDEAMGRSQNVQELEQLIGKGGHRAAA